MWMIPDETPPELTEVAETAAWYEITEYEVFRRAWRAWFGTEPVPGELERHFVRYMFRQDVPPWVRHYTRRVLGSRPRARAAAGRPAPMWLVPALALGALSLLALSMGGDLLPAADGCYFLPCY